MKKQLLLIIILGVLTFGIVSASTITGYDTNNNYQPIKIESGKYYKGVSLYPKEESVGVIQIIQGVQGGTGISSTPAGNIGLCLSVASVSPLTYTFGACAGGSGSFTTTTINGLSATNYTLNALGSLSIATSAPGTVTFTGTGITQAYVSSTFLTISASTSLAYLGLDYPATATSTFALKSEPLFSAYPALATSSFLGVGYPATATSTFVLKAGDIMTGNLELPGLVVSGTATTSRLCFSGTLNCQTDVVSGGSFVTFYHWNQASVDIPTYEMLRSFPNNGTQIIDSTTTIANTRLLLDSYISSSTADVNITSIPAGSWSFHTYASQSGNATPVSHIIYEIYRRATTGTEQLLFTVTSTDISGNTGATEFDFSSFQPALSWFTGDRLVAKVYAVSTVSGRTISFYYDGNTNYSHFITPIDISVQGFTRSGVNETITGNWTFNGGLAFINASGTSISTTNLYVPGQANILNLSSTTINYLNFINATGTLLKINTILATTGTYGYGNFTNVTSTGSVQFNVMEGVTSTITYFNTQNVTTTRLNVLTSLSLPNNSVADAMIASAATWNALVTSFNAYPALASSTFLTIANSTTIPTYLTVANSTTIPTYLKLSGGTMTGGLIFTTASGTSITSTNLAVENKKVVGDQKLRFTLTSSTIYSISATTTASTTINIPVENRALTFSNISCYTDTGTSTLRFGDGTNWTEVVTCGQTIGTDDGSIVNGSFTASEKSQIQIVNSSVGNPNQTAITVRYYYD